MNSERYKKFVCIKCGSSWFGFAKKPRCKVCRSRKINIYPAHIDNKELEYLGAKINKNEKMVKEENKEIPTDLDFIIIDDKTKDEEIRYKCGNCGEQNIKYRDLFCKDCGQALDVEWQ